MQGHIYVVVVIVTLMCPSSKDLLLVHFAVTSVPVRRLRIKYLEEFFGEGSALLPT